MTQTSFRSSDYEGICQPYLVKQVKDYGALSFALVLYTACKFTDEESHVQCKLALEGMLGREGTRCLQASYSILGLVVGGKENLQRRPTTFAAPHPTI